MNQQRRSSLPKSSARLHLKIQKLKSMGIVIPNKSSTSQNSHISNYFKFVEDSMKTDALTILRGSSQKPVQRAPRKIYAHQKVETSPFDTIEQLIVKNRTNLEYLKSYSRNIKESIKANTIHTTNTAKCNTIKKSVFIKEPQQKMIQDFVDTQMEQFLSEKSSISDHTKSFSVTMNNFGKMGNSSSMHQMRAATSDVSMRKSIVNPGKMWKIKMAAKQISQKQGELHREIKKSLRNNAGSAISIKSNLDRANILFGNRWNKIYNKITCKFGIENEDKLLAEQLELCPQRSNTSDVAKRPKTTVLNLDESREYLKQIPIMKFNCV